MSYIHTGRKSPKAQPKALKHDRLREHSREMRPTDFHSQAMREVIACLNAGAHAGIVAYQDAVTALLSGVLPAIELTAPDSQDYKQFVALASNPPYAPDATWRGLFASLLNTALETPTCDLFIQAVKRVARADFPQYLDSSPTTGAVNSYQRGHMSGTMAGWVTASVLSLASEIAIGDDTPTVEQLDVWSEWTHAQAREKSQQRVEVRSWHTKANVQYDAKSKREYTQSHGVLTRQESRAIRKQHAGAVITTWRHH